MIDWLTTTVTWVCFAAGFVVLVLALLGKAPSDFSVGLLLLGLLGVVVIGGVAVVSAISGDGAVGDVVEWVGYWVSCIVVGVGGGLWALIQRDRWGTVVLAVALLTIGVMVVRLDQVWFARGWA